MSDPQLPLPPTAAIIPPQPGLRRAVGGMLLTGGTSRRMGQDKTTLRVGGELNVRRLATALSRVAHPVLEVGPALSGLASVREDPPGEGPLAAIACGGRALRALGHFGPALVLACDLPFADEALLTFLCSRGDGDASVVPVVEGREQPLCARWSAIDLAVAGALVAVGERAVRAMPWGSDTDRPDEREWSAAVPAQSFADIDTPGDVERLGLSFGEAF